MKITVVRRDGSHEVLTLTEPLEMQRGVILNVIKTSTGMEHFFTPDGLYDGWGMAVKFEAATTEAALQEASGFIAAIEADREIPN